MCSIPWPDVLNQRLKSVHQRFCPAEDGLENSGDNDQEDQRTGDGMQEDRIQAPRPNGRRRGVITGARADIVRPLAAARDVLQNRKLDAGRRQGGGAGRSALHELKDFLNALALGGADERYRRTQLRGQFGGVHVPAAALQVVRHIKDHQRRQLQAENGCGEHQVAAQVGAIQNEE